MWGSCESSAVNAGFATLLKSTQSMGLVAVSRPFTGEACGFCFGFIDYFQRPLGQVMKMTTD